MTADEVLEEFSKVGALRRGHFVLSSGLHSPVFLQKNLVFAHPEACERLCKALAEKILATVAKPSVVISPAVGGIIPGYETARQLGLRSLYVEREGGAFKLRRGFGIEPGEKVVMVEDIVTTGLSSRECIAAIQAAGGDVVAAACIVDRSGGKADVGVPLIALATLDVPAYPADALPPELAAIPIEDPGQPEAGLSGKLRLGVNIDHVATIRNARGADYPDPVRAAEIALDAGADGITAHLREDRRHISDSDIARLAAVLDGRAPLNMEMAVTDEMLEIALRHRPHAVCLVPEKREERTTEGGLDVGGQLTRVTAVTRQLADAGSRVSLFIGADLRQVEAAKSAGAAVVEFHTGGFCDAVREGRAEAADNELAALRAAALQAEALGLEVHAGHGIDYETVTPIAALPQVMELNIGHFLIGESIFTGLRNAIQQMRQLMDEARP